MAATRREVKAPQSHRDLRPPKPRAKTYQERTVGHQRMRVAAWVSNDVIGDIEVHAKKRGVGVSAMVAIVLTPSNIMRAAERAPSTDPTSAPRQPKRFGTDRQQVFGYILPSIYSLMQKAAKDRHTSMSGIMAQALADYTGREP